MRIGKVSGRAFLIYSTILVAVFMILGIFFFYVYSNTIHRRGIELEKKEKQTKSQEAFDICVSRAEYEFIREYRDKCWVYNHDAIDCDLSYLEIYKIGERPQTKFKQAISSCEEQYPAGDRLYSFTRPDFISLLNKPIGNLTEREAIRKIIGLQEFKDFTNIRLGDGTKLRYEVKL